MTESEKPEVLQTVATEDLASGIASCLQNAIEEKAAEIAQRPDSSAKREQRGEITEIHVGLEHIRQAVKELGLDKFIPQSLLEPR